MIPDHPTQGDGGQKQGLVRLKKSIRRRDHGGEGHAIFLFAQYLTELKYLTGFVCHTVQQMIMVAMVVFHILGCKFILQTFSNLPSRLENRPLPAEVVPLPKP